MKTLTLQQPWATLVAIGAKKIETRSWRTNYRGQLAIHSSKKMSYDNFALCRNEPFYSVLKGVEIGNLDDFILGSVIATCKLVDVKPITLDFVMSLSNQEIAFGDYTPGRFAWILENVKILEFPIPAKGMLGLWERDN